MPHSAAKKLKKLNKGAKGLESSPTPLPSLVPPIHSPWGPDAKERVCVSLKGALGFYLVFFFFQVSAPYHCLN